MPKRSLMASIIALLVLLVVGLPIQDSPTAKQHPNRSSFGSGATNATSTSIIPGESATTITATLDSSQVDSAAPADLHTNLESLKLSNSSAYYHERQRINLARSGTPSAEQDSPATQRSKAKERIKSKLLAILDTRPGGTDE